MATISLWLDGSVVEKYRNIVTSCYTKSGIGHFTVVCLVTWPMNVSEAGGDLALIQTSLLFSFKCKLVSIRTT